MTANDDKLMDKIEIIFLWVIVPGSKNKIPSCYT